MMAEGRQHHNVTLAILTLAGTAFALQQTMVIPALPALQRDLHTTTKWPLAAGMALVAAAAGSLALWNDQPWQILAAMPVLGAGIGFGYAAMATLITEAVRSSETGVATGMNTVMRTVGGVVGGQVGAALLSAYTIRGTGGVPAVTGFSVAFAIRAVAALVGAGVAVFVTPPRLRRRERLVIATTEVSD